MTGLQIIPMQKEHLPALAELEKLCFSLPWSEKALEEELNNPSALFLTAVLSGKVVGYIGSHMILDEGAITNVAVDPEMRRQGIGAALLSALIENGKQKNLSFFTLEVRVSNTPAIRLYEKMGFENQGKRRNAYEFPLEDGFVMTRFLRSDREKV